MSNINSAYEIERLLSFANQEGFIEGLDIVLSRNLLLDLFKVDEPYCGQLAEEKLDSPVGILERLLDYAYEIGLLEENTVTYRDILDAKIMGLLMPRQSEVIRSFNNLYKEEGPKAATDNYYRFSKASNYIRVDRIEKNLYWRTNTEFGNLEITVNLSKPEKDPKEIAASKLRVQANYPKCLLCVENVGYAGHINHPARQNHRVIPMELNKEQWYLQYSPYVYYNEHCILFNGEHTPMKISEKTFIRLLDFVEQFPHYFVGSNADLPIVGGSILTHDHFQGGRHIFPMEEAKAVIEFSSEEYKGVKVGIVNWPMSVMRIASKNKEDILKLSVEILNKWREYSDSTVDILAYSEINGEMVPHNTVTPIARRNAADEYEVDLVLRNNRTSEEHPDGIFHPHKELHHIKKENIGLIEVMGLAVLPGRLSVELKEVASILAGDLNRLQLAKENKEDSLNKHIEWINQLVDINGTSLKAEEAYNIVKEAVGNKFNRVLMDAGVYKTEEKGRKAFVKFVESLGFKIN